MADIISVIEAVEGDRGLCEALLCRMHSFGASSAKFVSVAGQSELRFVEANLEMLILKLLSLHDLCVCDMDIIHINAYPFYYYIKVATKKYIFPEYPVDRF